MRGILLEERLDILGVRDEEEEEEKEEKDGR